MVYDGIEVDIGGDKRKVLELKKRIFYCLRHNSKDNSFLVSKVLKQARELGIEVVLANVTPEAKKLYSRYRSVLRECYKAKGMLVFDVYGDIQVARAFFEHRVEDLVLKHFMKRFPKKMIVLISKKVWVLHKNEIKVYPKEIFSNLDFSKNVRDELWEIYYDSQYIESRRNKRLALSRMPKKYSSRFRPLERIKIEKGIQKGTLDEWL